MSAELEFKVDGHTYRARRISAFDQMHVASEWRDVLMGLSLAKKNRDAKVTDEQFREATNIIVTGGLGRVAAQSREGITRLALGVVKRQERGGWADVATADGTVMFDDIRLPQIVSILYAVLDHNGLVDFFFAGPSASPGPKTGGSGRPSPEERTG